MEREYSYKEVEKRIYQRWLEKGAFNSVYDAEGKEQKEAKKKGTFVVPIPPPNVTGRLHLGHALNATIIDTLIRYKRMDGFDALWVPGIDHAGIATQTVVKKWLDAEGIDYRDLGRKAFEEKVWQWKEKYGSVILEQIKSLGASCDWGRTRFTMDEGFSKAVRKTFCRLYDDGLIYRGERIVNWCPVDKTALSDDEVEVKDGGEPGFLWHIKYLFAKEEEGEEGLIVATTRPETLFGDVAVAVHPDDERYKKHIGKMLRLPISHREIPIIADDYVERHFGTGCVKITPAHDPNDFEMGMRHHLKAVNIMNEDATMNDEVPLEYRGLDRFVCRKKLLDDLKSQGLLLKEESRNIPLGRSYRSKEIIEYRLSRQWFVKARPLAEKVLAKHDELSITPKNWDKVYRHWLENIRDWCISRQLWWGHPIPAWHHKTTGEILVGEEIPEIVLKNPELWQEDEDVLDTWFSSALWPMATLGWPDRKSPDFQHYFPSSLLSTAKDILFFWVARMNFMSVYFEEKMPYKEVYIHPVILDAKGQTMSKSKGNGIDPMHVMMGASLDDLKQPVLDARPKTMKTMLSDIEKNFPKGLEGVGADGLRYTLIQTCTSGQEVKIALSDFPLLGGRFIIKLWNAAYFVLSKANEIPRSNYSLKDLQENCSLEERWIRSRINGVALKTREALDTYDFSSLTRIFYGLVWNDYCDWTLEIAKTSMKSEDVFVRTRSLFVLFNALKNILKLLHPLIPFVTEELWSFVRAALDEKGLYEEKEHDNELIMLSLFPEAAGTDDEAEDSMGLIMEFVQKIRSLSSEFLIKERMDIVYFPHTEKVKNVLSSSKEAIMSLAKLKSMNEIFSSQKGFCLMGEGFEIYVRLKDFVDLEKEVEKMKKELLAVRSDVDFIEERLNNEGFVKKAPSERIEEQRTKLRHLLEKKVKLENLLSDLEES